MTFKKIELVLPPLSYLSEGLFDLPCLTYLVSLRAFLTYLFAPSLPYATGFLETAITYPTRGVTIVGRRSYASNSF